MPFQYERVVATSGAGNASVNCVLAYDITAVVTSPVQLPHPVDSVQLAGDLPTGPLGMGEAVIVGVPDIDEELDHDELDVILRRLVAMKGGLDIDDELVVFNGGGVLVGKGGTGLGEKLADKLRDELGVKLELDSGLEEKLDTEMGSALEIGSEDKRDRVLEGNGGAV